MQLLIARRAFDFKLHFNFLDVPFFVRARDNRCASDFELARPRRHSKRHQQTRAERAEEGSDRIDARVILRGELPLYRAMRDPGAEAVADSLDADLARTCSDRIRDLIGSAKIPRFK